MGFGLVLQKKKEHCTSRMMSDKSVQDQPQIARNMVFTSQNLANFAGAKKKEFHHSPVMSPMRCHNPVNVPGSVERHVWRNALNPRLHSNLRSPEASLTPLVRRVCVVPIDRKPSLQLLSDPLQVPRVARHTDHFKILDFRGIFDLREHEVNRNTSLSTLHFQ